MKKPRYLEKEAVDEIVCLLKEQNRVLENIVIDIDKIASKCDSYEKAAFVMLDYFNEEKVLDKLSYIRKLSYLLLEKYISEDELDDFLNSLDEEKI